MAETTPRLHYARNLCDEGGFKIAKVAHFQKQTFLTTSMTTDGTYLYLYVSASNGGMYKIGTGEKDTIAGKIYLFAAVCRQEEVAWVYCKGKLYLRSNAKEFGSIDVICPNTFKFEGMIQLHCPEVFGHPSLQIINKNYPLLTDGEYLYVIGKKLISEKINLTEEEEEIKKMEELKAKENEQIIYLSQIVEPNKPSNIIDSENKKNPEIEPKELLEELAPLKEISKEQPIEEIPKEQPKEEIPKEQPKEDIPKEELKAEIPQEIPKVEIPIELPKEEIPQEQPKEDISKKQYKEEIPKEQSKEEISKEELPKEQPKAEIPKEQLKEQIPKEPILKEQPKEEIPKEQNKEEILKENPKEEIPKEQPKEEIQKEISEVQKQKIPKEFPNLPKADSVENFENVSVEYKKESNLDDEINPMIPPEQIWGQLNIDKNESKPLDLMELEPDVVIKDKIDPKIIKEIMEKGGEFKDIFKEKANGDLAEIFKGDAKAKGSLFNKKPLVKEKDNNQVAAVMKREENKKKKDKKVVEIQDSEHTLKLCEFILYEFDLTNPLSPDCFNESNSKFYFLKNL